jgi:hypothetical protein
MKRTIVAILLQDQYAWSCKVFRIIFNDLCSRKAKNYIPQTYAVITKLFIGVRRNAHSQLLRKRLDPRKRQDDVYQFA